MVVLVKTLQVILALSLLIFIHELGHFIWARIFGIRVEKFYLFFDIRGKAIARWHWGETEFGIGWLPLGGYCKISGMVDESLDIEQLKKEPETWEFRSHPARQRLLVLAGGVLNNFIFAAIAFIAIAGIWGQALVGNKGSRIYVNELAYEMGFRTGDQILSFDDYVPEDFYSLQADLARRNVRKVTLLREDDTVSLYIDRAMIPQVLNSPLMFDMALPFVIDSVMSSRNSCLQKGDRIAAINGVQTPYVQDSRALLAELSGSQATASVIRSADTLEMMVQVDTNGHLGVLISNPEISIRRYSLLSAVPAGLSMTWKSITGYARDLKLMFTPSSGAYKSVGSFVAIGQIMPASWNSHQFLYILAMLSIMLGVMNLLPIPGLDGGHLLFTIFEMVTGRKPGEKFLYIAQLIGMLLLIMLMMLAFGNDIGRLIR